MPCYVLCASIRAVVEPIIPTLKELHTCGIAAQTCLRTNFVLPKVEHYIALSCRLMLDEN